MFVDAGQRTVRAICTGIDQRAPANLAGQLLIAACVLVGGTTVHATDHWDGPTASEEAAADITDFFAFPTEVDGAKRLVLLMNVHPGAQADAMFSHGVTQRIRLRSIQKAGSPTSPFPVADNEYRVDCRASGDTAPQQMHCKLIYLSRARDTKTTLATATVNTADPSGGGDTAFRVFAGPRADQSFTDLGRVRLPVWRDSSSSDRPGVNGLAGKNVLSLVIDLDLGKFFDQPSGLWAAVSETIVAYEEHGKSQTARIDRMGRLEVTVFLIRDDDLKDQWNAEDTFALDPAHVPAYRAELQDGMARLDNFEKSLIGADVIDWPVPHPLIDIYMKDFLVLDLDKATTPSNTDIHYLDIEMSLLAGVTSTSVGGRTPNEDVIARMMTVFINGPERLDLNRGVGVTSPGKPAVDSFPYVLPPYDPLGAGGD